MFKIPEPMLSQIVVVLTVEETKKNTDKVASLGSKFLSFIEKEMSTEDTRTTVAALYAVAGFMTESLSVNIFEQLPDSDEKKEVLEKLAVLNLGLDPDKPEGAH